MGVARGTSKELFTESLYLPSHDFFENVFAQKRAKRTKIPPLAKGAAL